MTGSAPSPKAIASAKVVVGKFPEDRLAEVHMATIDTNSRTLTMQPVVDNALGAPRNVSLSSAKSVECVEGSAMAMLVVVDENNKPMVELHFESVDEEAAQWLSCLRALIGVPASPASRSGRSGAQESPSDPARLLAKSQQLQSQISSLEAIGDRRDKQIQKMTKRVEGAARMLAAVQNMCEQQAKVLIVQREAAEVLRRECGLPAAAPEGNGRTSAGQQQDREPRHNEAEDEDDEEEDEEDGELDAATAEQMRGLLQQAEEMQNALAELKRMQTQCEAAAGGAGATAPMAAAPGQARQAEPVLSQLRTLEAEKERFEGMLRESQDEHDTLLNKLNEMKALMTAMGVSPEELAEMEGMDEAEGVNGD